jgi:hypothetical protein
MFYKRMKFILYLYIKFASLIIDNKDIMVRLGVISLVMLTLITGSLLTGISCSSESSDSSENNQIRQLIIKTLGTNLNLGNAVMVSVTGLKGRGEFARKIVRMLSQGLFISG